MIVSVSDAGDRYYLLPMYDMWTNVFHVPGTRTTGNRVGHFALVDPGWEGEVPDGVSRVNAPTPHMWIIGRTQCSGKADYEAVNRFQEGLTITPLSRWGQEPVPVKGTVDPTVDDKTPPLRQVFAMSPADYFAYAAELMKVHPPHVEDYPILARMERIGLVPGQDFDLSAADPAIRTALTRAVPYSQKRIRTTQEKIGWVRNNWQMITETIGVYGTDYLERATVDLIGLGANLPEDAVYPVSFVDALGQAYTGADSYVLHFEKAELPPARAFWSLTMYDDEGFPVANPLDRFAIGDRDQLVYNDDGSLDLYIQHDSAGADRESNWLPAPEGSFNLCLRLYYTKPPAIDGTWAPPAVQPAG